MIVEIVAVGTELLLGQIENSNASHIARRLAEEGFDAHYQVVVGDNLGRLSEAIAAGLARADALILTGGIGPTQDDLTREAICAVTDRPMARDEEHAAWIHARIASQGGTPRDNQLRMADIPQGAEPLPNRTGVALGVALEHDGRHIFALPGVPAEMRPMLDEQVMPRLRDKAGGPQTLVSRVIKTWGEGESAIADRLGDLFQSANPSVAFLIKDMEVQVRLTAKANDAHTARQLIAPVEEEVKRRLGGLVFGADDQTVESQIIEALTHRGWTVATVEQATLGQVGNRIASQSGAREIFRGTLIRPFVSPPPSPPEADVVLVVAAVEGGDGPATGTVPMTVITPDGQDERVFRLSGNEERVRTFATIAGLHVLRRSVS